MNEVGKGGGGGKGIGRNLHPGYSPERRGATEFTSYQGLTAKARETNDPAATLSSQKLRSRGNIACCAGVKIAVAR